MANTESVPLPPKAVGAAARLLVRAFAGDVLWNRVFPKQREREKKMEPLFRLVLRYGLRQGEVYASSAEIEGIAVWLPGDRAEMTLARTVSIGGLGLPFAVGLSGIMRLMRVDQHALQLRRRVAPFPHRCLTLLGVAPEHQGKGHARRLLEPVLARLDRERIPCYLETQNEHNVALYERFGFVVRERVEYSTLDFSTWCMLHSNFAS